MDLLKRLGVAKLVQLSTRLPPWFGQQWVRFGPARPDSQTLYKLIEEGKVWKLVGYHDVLLSLPGAAGYS